MIGAFWTNKQYKVERTCIFFVSFFLSKHAVDSQSLNLYTFKHVNQRVVIAIKRFQYRSSKTIMNY